MAKNKKLDLHPEPRQPVQLNRPLVLTLIIVVATIMLSAVITALTSSSRLATKSSVSPLTRKMAADKPIAINPELKNLPGSYSDVDLIKKYSADSDSSAQINALASQLGELQGSYSMLKRELESRVDTPIERKPEPPPEGARRSELLFSNLGSDATNLLGPHASNSPASRFGGKDSDKNADLVATPEQEAYFKKQNQNKLKLAAVKGAVDPERIINPSAGVYAPLPAQQVMAGTSIPASLITGINTSVRGMIVAQVRENVYNTLSGKHILIPKGSKLIGSYDSRVGYGQRRILMAFNRLIRPDGYSIILDDPFGTDSVGQSGIEGNVDNHWARVIGASTISVILDAGAGLTADKYGKSGDGTTAKERALLGAGSSISNTGKDIVQKAMNIAPTITLPPGHPFNVIVRKDLVLEPVKQRR